MQVRERFLPNTHIHKTKYTYTYDTCTHTHLHIRVWISPHSAIGNHWLRRSLCQIEIAFWAKCKYELNRPVVQLYKIKILSRDFLNLALHWLYFIPQNIYDHFIFLMCFLAPRGGERHHLLRVVSHNSIQDSFVWAYL